MADQQDTQRWPDEAAGTPYELQLKQPPNQSQPPRQRAGSSSVATVQQLRSKTENTSLAARITAWLCCCCSSPRQRRQRAATTTMRGSLGIPRMSATNAQSADKTPEQLKADKHLKKQIARYSTMRVHMKRVQLCLEQEKRNKFYKELVVYLVFLIVIMAALLSLPVHFPYEQNAALTNAFLQQQFPNETVPKTFYDVGQEEELWEWVQGPLLEGYYDSPLRNNRQIGSIMIRTGRVTGNLCAHTNGRDDFVLFANEICYPEFSESHEMKQPYGSSSGVMQQQYTWQDDFSVLERSQTFNPSLISHTMNYGRGGYAVFLPRDNATAAQDLVNQLQDDFLTDSTRYFVVNFAFYNPRSNIFTYVQALFELSDTDYMEVTGRVQSFRILSSYKNVSRFIVDNVFVIVLFLAAVWLFIHELADLREYGMHKYVKSLWNVLDVFQLLLLILFLAKWIEYLVKSESLREDLFRVTSMDCSGPANDQTAAQDCYVDLEAVSSLVKATNNYAASLALVSVAIVFKYLRLNTRLNLLWRTLRFAAKDLVGFAVIFFTIFFGFAVMGFLTFGSYVRGYHSLSDSLTSCFQMLLGAFDYDSINVANPTMAGIFFFSFMISIYLICVNMFIAIMSEYYSVAQKEMRTREANKKKLVEESKSSNSKFDDDFTDSLQFTDVEYDIAKQIKNYLLGVRMRVRLPPLKSSSSPYSSQQLLLTGYQRVLLVDYNYLMAERKRLRAKFRACVHVVMTVYGIYRNVYPNFHMQLDPQVVPDKRRRASSIDSVEDLVDYPVTYIPISSAAANTVEVLRGLKAGMLIDVDDGSLTKDQITLQVIGDQDAYVPERFKRREDPFGQNAVHNEEMEVRISEDPNDGPDGGPPFGLCYKYDDIGNASHIRCCRVLYNGDTMLNGGETCMMPKRTWARYYLMYVLWGYVRDFFSCGRRKKKPAQRLITDAEVDKLITENFTAPGRGISCRFDELVRNFRMFIIKKSHRRNMRLQNMEDRIFVEVISFLERFPSALTQLDKRELEGFKYVPHPVDTSRIRLPNSVNLLTELLSQNAHEVWAVGRIDQGWLWGPQRDNDKLLHPDLVPYEALTEEDKQYDRDTSLEALKVITALGYILEPPETMEDMDYIKFGTAATEEGGTYVPLPIPTDTVVVPPHLKSAIELLAENTHEVWAKMRMDQGWKYGPRRDDDKREHNGLVPYFYLTQDEKQMDRNTAMQTVKLILRCGYTFVHKDKQRSHRAKKKQSGQFKVFGRNENPDPKNVSDAATILTGTARAKRAFMKRHSKKAANSGLTNRTSSVGSAMSSTSMDMESSAWPTPTPSNRSQSLFTPSHSIDEAGAISSLPPEAPAAPRTRHSSNESTNGSTNTSGSPPSHQFAAV